MANTRSRSRSRRSRTNGRFIRLWLHRFVRCPTAVLRSKARLARRQLCSLRSAVRSFEQLDGHGHFIAGRSSRCRRGRPILCCCDAVRRAAAGHGRWARREAESFGRLGVCCWWRARCLWQEGASERELSVTRRPVQARSRDMSAKVETVSTAMTRSRPPEWRHACHVVVEPRRVQMVLALAC